MNHILNLTKKIYRMNYQVKRQYNGNIYLSSKYSPTMITIIPLLWLLGWMSLLVFSFLVLRPTFRYTFTKPVKTIDKKIIILTTFYSPTKPSKNQLLQWCLSGSQYTSFSYHRFLPFLRYILQRFPKYTNNQNPQTAINLA